MLPEELPCTGQRYKIICIESALLQIKHSTLDNSELTTLKLSGFQWKIFEIIVSKLNFTYELLHFPKGHYGTLFSNNTWSGAVGELHANKSDIILAAMRDSHQRRTVIDFSFPYLIDTVNFFVGVPEPVKSTSMIYLKPFQYYVWITFLLMFMLVLCFLYKLFRSNTDVTPASAVMFVLAIALQQGVTVKRCRIYTATIITPWMLSCTILSIFYNDYLTAAAGFSYKNNIDTLNQLATHLNSGTMKFQIAPHNSLIDYVKNMPDSPYGEIFRRSLLIKPKKPSLFNDVQHLRVTTPSSQLEMTLILHEMGFTETKIRAVREPLATSYKPIVFRKDFPCKEAMNRLIVRLYETGCLLRWQEELKWPIRLQRLKDAQKKTVLYIGFQDLKIAFVMLWGSYLSAIGTYTMKIIWLNYKSSKKTYGRLSSMWDRPY